jgi:hypothetical protein
MGAISWKQKYDSNFVLFVCRLKGAPCRVRDGLSLERFVCTCFWTEHGASRDSAVQGLLLSAAIHFNILFIPLSHALPAIVKIYNIPHFFKLNALYLYSYNTLYKWIKTLQFVVESSKQWLMLCTIGLCEDCASHYLESCHSGFMQNK